MPIPQGPYLTPFRRARVAGTTDRNRESRAKLWPEVQKPRREMLQVAIVPVSAQGVMGIHVSDGYTAPFRA
jgi:hypothetical protein